jgi:hypothetical protein
MVKKWPWFERPTSYQKLNFPAQIFCGTEFYICIVLGRSYLWALPPSFFKILLIFFRFL